MKVKFCCDNGANIHSQLTEVIDTQKYFDLTDEQWIALSDDEKYNYVQDWALEKFNYWFEED